MAASVTPEPASSADRIVAAERAGLRLAVLARSAVILTAMTWYLGVPFVTTFQPRAEAGLVLGGFALVGLAYAAIIGTRADRPFMKYAIFAVDILTVAGLFAVLPVSDAEPVPQIVAFRAYGIYYLFPLIALSVLSLSWRLVAWSGMVAVAAWWGAFLIAIGDTAEPLSWADMDTGTRAQYESIFLSIDFVGYGNRFEETGLLLAATLVLALAVWRARRTFRSLLVAEADRETARTERALVRGALGAFVPEAMVDSLVAGAGTLEPQTRDATVLMVDIAGFTPFATERSPDEVIDALDAFLVPAGEIVADAGGIVTGYTGDGLLAAFGVPLALDDSARAAIAAAQGLAALPTPDGLPVRIGIASGPVSAGTIGGRSRAFTIYGETVNRAARLEAAGKLTGFAINLDEASASHDGKRERRSVEVDLPGLGPTTVYAAD